MKKLILLLALMLGACCANHDLGDVTIIQNGEIIRTIPNVKKWEIKDDGQRVIVHFYGDSFGNRGPNLATVHLNKNENWEIIRKNQ